MSRQRQINQKLEEISFDSLRAIAQQLLELEETNESLRHFLDEARKELGELKRATVSA